MKSSTTKCTTKSFLVYSATSVSNGGSPKNYWYPYCERGGRPKKDYWDRYCEMGGSPKKAIDIRYCDLLGGLKKKCRG